LLLLVDEVLWQQAWLLVALHCWQLRLELVLQVCPLLLCTALLAWLPSWRPVQQLAHALQLLASLPLHLSAPLLLLLLLVLLLPAQSRVWMPRGSCLWLSQLLLMRLHCAG
jgi:hypothetical protein